MVHDEQRHRFVLAGQPAQRRQPHGGRRLTDDAEIFAEPPAEIVPERVHDLGVVVDHEQDGLGHPLPLSRTAHCTAAGEPGGRVRFRSRLIGRPGLLTDARSATATGLDHPSAPHQRIKVHTRRAPCRRSGAGSTPSDAIIATA